MPDDIWLAFMTGMIAAFILSGLTVWTAQKRNEKKNPAEIVIHAKEGWIIKVEFNGMTIKKIERLINILWENEDDEKRPQIR